MLGWLILAIWPALMFGGGIYEGVKCGWTRGLYQDIACKSPLKPQAHYNLGVAYRNKGNWNGAIEEFERAAALATTEHCDEPCRVKNIGAVALSNIAAFYMDNGGERLFATAGEVLQRARQDFPPHEAVLANSIEYFIQTGEWGRAEHFTEAALQFAPKAAILYGQKADVMAVLGRCAERDEAIATMNRLDPLLQVDGVVTVRPCSGGL